MMLCSKLHCQQFFKLKPFSYKIGVRAALLQWGSCVQCDFKVIECDAGAGGGPGNLLAIRRARDGATAEAGGHEGGTS